jgi:mannitol/fructose-specific phosphotransferase system IIA component (Ntr-type)
MPLASLIPPEAVIAELRATERDAVHEEMVAHLIDKKLLPSDLRASVLANLREREQKMTTAIGQGIALPHASVAGLPGVLAMAARSAAGIECQALDNQPVYLFFMVLVPADQYSVHLRTLASVAKFLNTPGTREALRSAASAAEIHQLFQKS